MPKGFSSGCWIYIPTGWCSTELVNLLDSSDTVTVSNGQFEVNIQNGQPKVYYPASEQTAEKVVAANPVTEGKTSAGEWNIFMDRCTVEPLLTDIFYSGHLVYTDVLLQSQLKLLYLQYISALPNADTSLSVFWTY